jgi:hypothetical protein
MMGTKPSQVADGSHGMTVNEQYQGNCPVVRFALFYVFPCEGYVSILQGQSIVIDVTAKELNSLKGSFTLLFWLVKKSCFKFLSEKGFLKGWALKIRQHYS